MQQLFEAFYFLSAKFFSTSEKIFPRTSRSDEFIGTSYSASHHKTLDGAERTVVDHVEPTRESIVRRNSQKGGRKRIRGNFGRKER